MFLTLSLHNIHSNQQLRGFVVFAFFLILILPVCLAHDAARAGEEKALPLPTRIVSLGPFITENIYLLGADEMLVGNTIYCKRPEMAQFKEKVGSVQELSIEKILSLKPDLVLASNLASPLQTGKLKNLGLRVENIREMASFEDICTEFLRLGHLLGRTQQANEIVEQARSRVAAVGQAVSGLPRKKVFLQVGANPLFASVDKSFTNDFIRLAGGENIVAGQRSGSVKVEQVIVLNPDVIVVAVMGTEHGTGADEQKKWCNFQQIHAVQQNRVHVMDPNLICSPSPRTFAETLEKMALLIHPDLVLTPDSVSSIQ